MLEYTMLNHAIFLLGIVLKLTILNVWVRIPHSWRVMNVGPVVNALNSVLSYIFWLNCSIIVFSAVWCNMFTPFNFWLWQTAYGIILQQLLHCESIPEYNLAVNKPMKPSS